MTANLPIEIPDLGELRRIRVQLASANNWLLAKMSIKNLDSEKEVVFENTEWIEKGMLKQKTFIKQKMCDILNCKNRKQLLLISKMNTIFYKLNSNNQFDWYLIYCNF